LKGERWFLLAQGVENAFFFVSELQAIRFASKTAMAFEHHCFKTCD
jgi:hypothetical protein